jgi:hypothetical protein
VPSCLMPYKTGFNSSNYTSKPILLRIFKHCGKLEYNKTRLEAVNINCICISQRPPPPPRSIRDRHLGAVPLSQRKQSESLLWHLFPSLNLSPSFKLSLQSPLPQSIFSAIKLYQIETRCSKIKLDLISYNWNNVGIGTDMTPTPR